MPEKYVFTAAQDAEIIRVYTTTRKAGGPIRLAKKYGISPSLISKRAAILRCPPLANMANRITETTWKPEELQIVQTHLGKATATIRAALVKQGYHRSPQSIVSIISKKRRNGEWPAFSDQVEDADSFMIQDVAEGLGVSRDKVIRWIGRRLLKARKLRDEGDGCYVIRRKHLYDFLTQYVAHWEHAYADRWFLVDVLAFSDRSPKMQHIVGFPERPEI